MLHYNLKLAKAWHKAVLANSPFAYKTFHENYSNSLYAPTALKLYGAPKAVPLMQFTHLAKQSPSYKHGNFGASFAHNKSGGGAGPFQHMPGHGASKPFGNGNMGPLSGKNGHSPFNAGNNGKFSRMPNRFNNNPMRGGNKPMFGSGPRHFGGGMGGGRFGQRFASGPSRMSFARGGFGGGRLFGGGRSFGGGFRRR